MAKKKSSERINKAKFWVGVLYPENMLDNWENALPDIVQVPFAYCLHTADIDVKSEHRKDHLHLILAFNNTTTYNHAFNVFKLLSAPDKSALNTCKAVIDIRHMYDYLIHDTENCRKQGKYLYPASSRILGNNFDIGIYEQLSLLEKDTICQELCDLIVEMNFTNFADFYVYVTSSFDDSNYFQIIRSYSSLFERLTKANYLKSTSTFTSPSEGQHHENTTENTTENFNKKSVFYCPICGSISVLKDGKTGSGSQRMRCRDCGKRFTI